VGCGIGAIALSIKRKFPAIETLGVDRDALAVRMSLSNARLNRLDCSFRGSLVLGEDYGRRFDAVLSNVPAKVGPPVLDALIDRLAELGSTVAIVVVEPLADQIQRSIDAADCQVVLREGTAQHVVYHYRGRKGVARSISGWDAFLRKRGEYQIGPWDYKLSTVYGLPDFDTPSYGDQIAAELLAGSGVPRGDKWLVWHPGQGHLITAISRSKAARDARFTLASRDLLELEVSRRNLVGNGVDPSRVDTRHCAFVQDCEGEFQVILYTPARDPGYLWQGDLLAAADRLVGADGHLVVVARSTDAYRLVAKREEWKVLDDARERGFRVLVLGGSRS
jgi:16S rRNA G1207 methylase RsmC